jgi:hypothetical protein
MAPVYIRKIPLRMERRLQASVWSTIFSFLIILSNFRLQQKLAYGYDQFRYIVTDVKIGLLVQIRKFKGIHEYGELISFLLQLLLPTQLLHFLFYIQHYSLYCVLLRPTSSVLSKLGVAIYFTKKKLPAHETNILFNNRIQEQWLALNDGLFRDEQRLMPWHQSQL